MLSLHEKISAERAAAINPIVLAFVGDAVYSLYVREELAASSDAKAGELNRCAVERVNARAQADFAAELMPYLSEEESAVYRRARNAKKGTKSKSSSVAEYNMSTGFEAVVGYLYLIGNEARLSYLLNLRKQSKISDGVYDK